MGGGEREGISSSPARLCCLWAPRGKLDTGVGRPGARGYTGQSPWGPRVASGRWVGAVAPWGWVGKAAGQGGGLGAAWLGQAPGGLAPMVGEGVAALKPLQIAQALEPLYLAAALRDWHPCPPPRTWVPGPPHPQLQCGAAIQGRKKRTHVGRQTEPYIRGALPPALPPLGSRRAVPTNRRLAGAGGLPPAEVRAPGVHSGGRHSRHVGLYAQPAPR